MIPLGVGAMGSSTRGHTVKIVKTLSAKEYSYNFFGSRRFCYLEVLG